MSKAEQQFMEEICEHLDRSLGDIDSTIAPRLDAARSAALLRQSSEDSELDESLFTDSVLSALEDHQQPEFVNKRLDAMRAQAVGRLGSRAAAPARNKWLTWVEQLLGGGIPLSASMVATACVLLTVVSLVYVNGSSNTNLSLNDELMMVASAEDLELYENLDFYLWLDENGFAN